MFQEHVEVAVLDGQESAFEAALCEVRQRVFMLPGFRGFAVAQGVTEHPSTYWVQVLWETPEELAAFVDSRFERCWAPVAPFVAGSPRVNHFVERPGLALTGPGVISDLAWLSE